MKRVIIEAGDPEKHAQYLQKCLHDSRERGEAPIASHVFHSADEKEHGWAWLKAADAIVVYKDVSDDTPETVKKAKSLEIPVEYREIEDWNGVEYKVDAIIEVGAFVIVRANSKEEAEKKAATVSTYSPSVFSDNAWSLDDDYECYAADIVNVEEI